MSMMNRVDRETRERKHRERGEELKAMLAKKTDRGPTYLALATEMQASFTAAIYYASLKVKGG